MNPYTHDLYGREVSGAYWGDLEANLEDDARTFRDCGDERAAAIADRLAETVDAVPAQVMAEYQACWDCVDQYPPGQSLAERTIHDLIDSLAAGYSPAEKSWIRGKNRRS